MNEGAIKLLGKIYAIADCDEEIEPDEPLSGYILIKELSKQALAQLKLCETCEGKMEVYDCDNCEHRNEKSVDHCRFEKCLMKPCPDCPKEQKLCPKCKGTKVKITARTGQSDYPRATRRTEPCPACQPKCETCKGSGKVYRRSNRKSARIHADPCPKCQLKEPEPVHMARPRCYGEFESGNSTCIRCWARMDCFPKSGQPKEQKPDAAEFNLARFREVIEEAREIGLIDEYNLGTWAVKAADLIEKLQQ